jgi:6,7-dimethyl-8-ribityllumazine synthase
MAKPAKPPAAPSSELTIVSNTPEIALVPRHFTIAMLKALPQQTITALDGHTHTSSTFTGPLASDVFGATGLASDDKTHSLILRGLVIAEGTDHYRVVYSMAELEPTFTSGKVIVALTRDGKPIESGIQLINPLDVKPARWVHGLTILAFSAVPLSK